jgi:S-DNA-T family DNA segregation ATPase FtsK/SpoIIIE
VTRQRIDLVLRAGEHALVTGPPRSGKSTALLTIAAVLRDHPDVQVHAVADRPSSPLRTLPGCVGRFEELVVDEGRTHVVVVDDAESVDDPFGFVAGARDDVHVIAAVRTDAAHAAYGHWTRELRRSRLGLVLHADVEDGALVGAVLPRRREPWTVAGRGYLVVDGRPELVQVARP